MYLFFFIIIYAYTVLIKKYCTDKLLYFIMVTVISICFVHANLKKVSETDKYIMCRAWTHANPDAIDSVMHFYQ